MQPNGSLNVMFISNFLHFCNSYESHQIFELPDISYQPRLWYESCFEGKMIPIWHMYGSHVSLQEPMRKCMIELWSQQLVLPFLCWAIVFVNCCSFGCRGCTISECVGWFSQRSTSVQSSKLAAFRGGFVWWMFSPSLSSSRGFLLGGIKLISCICRNHIISNSKMIGHP